MKEKELLTASSQNALLACMRRYYYRYELCLQHTTEKAALRFGSAWHRAMEARWHGATGENALAAAIADVETLDEMQVATLTGLLMGYYNAYQSEPVSELMPEQQFHMPIERSNSFEAAGKIDGLGKLIDGRAVLVEHKTTIDSVAPDSDYWTMLRFNIQILQYIHAAREMQIPIEVVLYDVTRKPAISPKAIPILDENGCKTVLDANGQRVYKKDGKPRESAGEAMTLQTRIETPEEFASRLSEDTTARPDFYFARREIPVLDTDINEFVVQRLEIGRIILALRQAQKKVAKPHQAWPRNCSKFTCAGCEFKDFCLQNIDVNPEQPPAGFVVTEKHRELAGGGSL